MAEKTREEQIALGRRIEQLVKEPEVAAAFKDMEEDITRQWKTASTQNEREQLWGEIRAVAEFQRRVNLLVVRGQRAQIDAEKEAAKHKK